MRNIGAKKMEKIDYFEFKQIIKRLEVEYGELEEQKMKLHYDKLRNFPSWVLKQMVNTILETHERMYYPKLGILIKAAEGIQRFGKSYQDQKPIYCEKCNSTGWRFLDWIEKDGTKREQGFRCDCENGRRLSHKIHTYSEVRVKLGIPPQKAPDLILKDYIEDIKADPSQVFEDGVCVRNSCKKCGNPYYVNFKGKTTARQVLDCYEGGRNLCDTCHAKEGEKLGYWIIEDRFA